MTDSIINVQNVSYTYGDGTKALKNVSLEIPRNEVFVLFGPSRAGKTTLMRLMNRLSDLQENATHTGTVEFAGQSVFSPGTDVIALRRRIGMVFAVPIPLPGTIYENLTFGLKMAGIKNSNTLNERVERSLRQSALWDEVKDRLDDSAFALSGGQKQRLCLARSLALEPDVILLDNPTSGLDPISTSIVEQSLIELKKQYTIIMVPHSVQQASRVADRAAFLLDGEVIETGEQTQIFVYPQQKRTEEYVTGRFG